MKEPLRSRALADWNRIVEEYDAPKNGIQSISEAVARVWDYAHFETFWNGVRKFYNDLPRPNRGDAAEGWDMAKECAPGGEEKQPEPPAPETWSEKEIADWKEIGRVDMSKYFPRLIHSEALGDNQVLFMGEDGPVLAEIPAPKAKPIATVMTIEMQHEKRIEALEARVKDLEEIVKYLSLKANGTK